MDLEENGHGIGAVLTVCGSPYSAHALGRRRAYSSASYAGYEFASKQDRIRAAKGSLATDKCITVGHHK